MSASGDNNRSVRFTKLRIRTAFFELMKAKSIHKIIVAEIVRIADISRATFYLHYVDIYDLLNKTEEEIINCVLSEVAKFDENTYVIGKYPIARRVFEVLNTHSQEITLLLCENGDVTFHQKFQSALKEYFKSLLVFVATETDIIEPVLSFLIGGVLNMFMENLSQEKKTVDINKLAMISNRYLRVTNKLIGLPEVEPDN